MFSSADAYERFMGRWSRRMAPSLVAFAEVRDGARVLDVGSGTGALAVAVRAAAPTADVTGIDPSAEYVAHATTHADPHLRFLVGDARSLPEPDASFDRTLSLLVMNFIPDPARAAAEMARVTRPGGVVAVAVWDYGDGMEMLRAFWDAAVALDPALDARDERHLPLCRDGELADLLGRSGLDDIRASALTITLSFTSFDDYWSPFLLGQGPAGALVATLPPPRRDALAQHLRTRLLGTGPDRPVDLRARAWAARGTRS